MRSVALLLVELTLKSSLLLCLGLAVAALPRLSAAARHLILFAALVAALSLPALSFLLPATGVPSLTSIAATNITPDFAIAHSMSSEPSSMPPWLQHSLSVLTPFLFAIWVGGALLCTAHVAMSRLALRRVLLRARTMCEPDWLQLLDECCARISLQRRPRLLSSWDTDVPLACGLIQPTIVIPHAAHDWPEARRRDVLLHELAHIERRDVLTQCVAQLARALHFWNPLAIVAERRLREERECACDDRVLTCGQAADTYATTLLEVAASLSHRRVPVALAMAQTSQLEKRVVALLDRDRRRDGVNWAKVVWVAIPSACLLLPLATLRAIADDEPYVSTDSRVMEFSDTPDAVSEILSVNGDEVRRITVAVGADGQLHRTLLMNGSQRVLDSEADRALLEAQQLEKQMDDDSAPSMNREERVQGAPYTIVTPLAEATPAE